MFSISRVFHKKLWSAMLTSVLLLFAGAACAKVIPLHAALHPCAGVQTSGVGAMKGTYNTVSHMVTWEVTYSHLTSDVIMAHFHGPISKPGASAPVQVWLTKRPPHPMAPAPIIGKAKISPKQAKELLGGHWYVTIHTVKYHDGEMRGRIYTN